MAKNIEPKLKKIGDYLKLDGNAVFVIPEYQRAYSWGIDRCDKLWQDILDFAESESRDRYFFGTIIINCQDNDEKLGLIDGQQRTTTFLLLLKAFLVKINTALGHMRCDEDSAGLYRGLQERRRRIMGILYKAETEDVSDKPDRETDADICSRSIVLENYSINERYRSELAVILQAVDLETAETKVIHFKYKQKDNRYTNFFRNYKFFFEKIDELQLDRLNRVAKAVIDDCEVIEIKSWQVEQAITMFNSLNSDGLPLYDSDIISAKLYAEAEKCGEAETFAGLWKKLNELLNNENIANVVDLNSILMQYMYYIRAINGETVSDGGSVNVTTPGLRRYFTEINKKPLADPVSTCEALINLVKIWDKVSNDPVAKILFKFNENSKLFLASYFQRFDVNSLPEDDITAVLLCMLRLFAVLELVDVGYSSKNFKMFLFCEQVKLTDINIPAEEIKRDFDKHIRNCWNENDITVSLQDYSGNALVYLNEYLFACEIGERLDIGNKYDVEHIMPNSGRNLQEIKNDAGILNDEEFAATVNKLGNKILLEEKINRAIGNEWFRTKVSTKLESKTGYIDSRFPIARALVKKYLSASKPFWKRSDIESATNKASERIVKFIFEG